MKKLMIAAVAALVMGTVVAETPYDKMTLKGRTDKENPVDYKVGEKIGFTIFTADIDKVPAEGLKLKWKRLGDDGKVQEGEAPFKIGDICTIETTLDRPGFVKYEAKLVDAKGEQVMRDVIAPGEEAWTNNKKVEFVGGAGVEIEKIQQIIPEPRDFDEYWAKQKKILAATPMRAFRFPAKGFENDPDQRIEGVYVTCAGTRPVTGFLVMPKNAKPKSCSAFLGVQGYGCYVPSIGKQDNLGNQIRFFVNAHGLELEADKDYYDDYFAMIKTSDAPWTSYAWNIVENQKADTCYFRWMAMRVMRALEFLKSLPEWNGVDLIVEGGSQGGLQTAWAAGLDPDVSLARPCVPWCCDFGLTVSTKLRGHWHIPYAPGLDYFDAINHIKRAKCPVEITRAGLADYTSPPSGVAALFNAIPGKGSIKWVQGSHHGNTPPLPNQIKIIEK